MDIYMVEKEKGKKARDRTREDSRGTKEEREG